MELRQLVEERLGSPIKCYGHCEGRAALRFLPTEGEEMLVACCVCPSGYVSRIVAYGRELDLARFKRLLSEATAGLGEVADEDIRVATRYPWNLGLEAEGEGPVLRQAYWTQNYRRTRREDPRRPALFLCQGCGTFYVQPADGVEHLCPRCREAGPS